MEKRTTKSKPRESGKGGYLRGHNKRSSRLVKGKQQNKVRGWEAERDGASAGKRGRAVERNQDQVQ